MTKSSILLIGIAVLAGAPTAPAQHKPRSSDAIAGDFNKSAQTIQDEIDALRKKLSDDSLSMSDAAGLIEQQSRLRKKLDDSWATTQKEIDESFSYKRKEITQYNSDNQKLEYQSAISGSQIDLLNNVAKYPEKSLFEKNKDEMSKAWEQTYGSRLKPFGPEFAEKKAELFKTMKESYGIDLEKDGYSRIGTINPYTGEVYYKYYGKGVDGVERLQMTIWENDAKGWEKSNADFKKSRARQQELKESLAKEADQLTKNSDKIKAVRNGLSGSMTALEGTAKKVDFAGNWSGQDNLGNWIKLTLNRDGTTRYTWGRTSTVYDGAGTWKQTGTRITMRTDDGEWSHESTITDKFQLQFIEKSATGRTYTNYLSR